MVDLSSKKSNYISRVQAGVEALLNQVANLEELIQEGTSLGYVGGSPSLADADFVGANGFLTATVFNGVVTTLTTLDGTLHANNATILQSLYQMRR